MRKRKGKRAKALKVILNEIQPLVQINELMAVLNCLEYYHNCSYVYDKDQHVIYKRLRPVIHQKALFCPICQICNNHRQKHC